MHRDATASIPSGRRAADVVRCTSEIIAGAARRLSQLRVIVVETESREASDANVNSHGARYATPEGKNNRIIAARLKFTRPSIRARGSLSDDTANFSALLEVQRAICAMRSSALLQEPGRLAVSWAKRRGDHCAAFKLLTF